MECRLSTRPLDTAQHSSTQADGVSPIHKASLDTAQHRQMECRRMSPYVAVALSMCRLSTGNRQIECRLSTRPLHTQARSTLKIDTGLSTHRPLHTQACSTLTLSLHTQASPHTGLSTHRPLHTQARSTLTLSIKTLTLSLNTQARPLNTQARPLHHRPAALRGSAPLSRHGDRHSTGRIQHSY